MTSWSDRIFFSLQLDCEVARVSGFDDHCQEHFIIVETGRGYRDRRDAAVLKIVASIEAGDVPGEIDARPEPVKQVDWRE